MIPLNTIPGVPGTVLYRYRGQGDHSYMNLKIVLDEYLIIKETKAGWWIDISKLNYIKGKRDLRTKKWVGKSSQRSFAYDTKDKALINFAHRKARQIRILKEQLAQAKEERVMVRKMIDDAKINVSNRYII